MRLSGRFWGGGKSRGLKILGFINNMWMGPYIRFNNGPIIKKNSDLEIEDPLVKQRSDFGPIYKEIRTLLHLL